LPARGATKSSGGQVFNSLPRNYRVIKKSLCAWWLQYVKLQIMFRVSLASLQTFIDMPNCFFEDQHGPCSEFILWWPSSSYQLCRDCSNTLEFCITQRLFDHPV
jgi:hypothetical protein